MLIRLGYDIRFKTGAEVPFIAMLNVHPSRQKDLREPDILSTDPPVRMEQYVDVFGNTCSRFLAPPGDIQLFSSSLIEDSGMPDPVCPEARQLPLEDLPPETLWFLLASRYCETDLLSDTAIGLFGNTTPGWPRVQAIVDWVHNYTTFGYQFARPTKTALDVFRERQGVCRDFQHLAISFCRCMNIPARYATGYLGDIGVPASPAPMDFSAWFEVYLEDRWWAFDARHNQPRTGRILMAVGRDAADVALTTTFGPATMCGFSVVTDEVQQSSSNWSNIGEQGGQYARNPTRPWTALV
jgi:transglutaminase-like putative cysteine protease